MLSIVNMGFSRREFLRLAAAGGLGYLVHYFRSAIALAGLPSKWQDPDFAFRPGSLRILLFADEHLGMNFRPGQANFLALPALNYAVDRLSSQDFDIALNLGDLIDADSDEDTNIRTLETGVNTINRLPFTKKYLDGNHEHWGISPAGLNHARSRLGLNPPYGYTDTRLCRLVWTDLATNGISQGYMPGETLAWLREEAIPKDTPSIVFAHYPPTSKDSRAGPHYNGHPEFTSPANGPEIVSALRGLPVIAYVAAHTHLGSFTAKSGFPEFTIHSFTQNIASADTLFVPGNYSVLELNNPGQYSLKTFYTGKCFQSYEIDTGHSHF